MDFKKIDLHKNSTKQSKGFKKLWLFLIAGALVLVTFFIWSKLPGDSTVFNFPIPGKSGPNIKNTDDKVNILLLGNAGANHDGPYLTDSIIVASYNLKTNKALLISIPRDLWLDEEGVKINAIYERGLRDDTGLELAKKRIGEVVGLPIHYGIRLDFSGFAEAIDLVEGVDVEIPKAFDDYNYPIPGKEDELCDYKEEERELNEEQIKALNLPTPAPAGLWYSGKDPVVPGKRKVLIDPQGQIATDPAKIKFNCRYEHIHFDLGKITMDGETALKFVRSRMGTNGEGSDFARSRRQQLVLQGFREKALSLETLVNPIKVTGLITTLGNSVETDIPLDDYAEFYGLAKKQEGVQNLVLGDLGDGKSILITPPPGDYGGAFVLIPEKNDFTKVKELIKNKLDEIAKEEEVK